MQLRTTRTWLVRHSGAIALALVFATATIIAAEEVQVKLNEWKIHDMERPQPAVIAPGTASTADKARGAPSDAIVLFDGTSTEAWSNESWRIVDGAMLVGKGTNRTKQGFGSCQLHIEWASPAEVTGKGQLPEQLLIVTTSGKKKSSETRVIGLWAHYRQSIEHLPDGKDGEVSPHWRSGPRGAETEGVL